jgi:hypothetical protein
MMPFEVRWDGILGDHAARLIDISLGGCYIESINQMAVGQPIRFEVSLPTGEWVTLHGQVAYTHPNVGFGVCFTELSTYEQDKLEQLMSYALRT